MLKFSEAPLPDESHYVGIIFTFENMENDLEYLLTVHDKDKYKGFTNIKLPGGSSEERYENTSDYMETLKFTLGKIGFEEKVRSDILERENTRFDKVKKYPGKGKLIIILRTMVIESLEELGYYPMDFEPYVIHVTEKPGHTQYFLWVHDFIDMNGKEVFVPNLRDGFIPPSPNLVETRVHMEVKDTYNLIHSHRLPVEKYLETRRRNDS